MCHAAASSEGRKATESPARRAGPHVERAARHAALSCAGCTRAVLVSASSPVCCSLRLAVGPRTCRLALGVLISGAAAPSALIPQVLPPRSSADGPPNATMWTAIGCGGRRGVRRPRSRDRSSGRGVASGTSTSAVTCAARGVVGPWRGEASLAHRSDSRQRAKRWSVTRTVVPNSTSSVP